MPATRPRLKGSTGCDQCRQRRKKCDESHPTCTACSRWQLSCTWKGGPPQKTSCQLSGLQVILPLIGQKRKPIKPPPSSLCESAPRSGCLTVIIGQQIMPGTTEVALHQFLRGYSFLNKSTSTVDPLYGSVEPLLDKLPQDPSSCGLNQALEAISLAYMGSQNGDIDLLNQAQGRYMVAIKTLRGILEGSGSFAVNKVLAAIRLCTGYEFRICDDPATAGWAYHMKGQATLARSLLPELSKRSQKDRRLFNETLLSIAVVHGYARAPMPFTVKEIEETVADEEDLDGEVAVLSLRVNAIRRTADSLAGMDISDESLHDAEAMLEKAKILSKDLESWEAKMETSRPYELVRIEDYVERSSNDVMNAECWSTEVHHYQSLHDANTYNQARCWLIYTFAASIQVKLWLYSQQRMHDTEPDTALDFVTIQAACDNICATVPYYLGLYEQTRHLDNPHRRRINTWGGGSASLWFWLATVVGIESISELQRKWLLGRIAFIGDKLGHKWAQFIAKNPPSDVILGSNISTRTRSMYKAIPGWPSVNPDTAAVG